MNAGISAAQPLTPNIQELPTTETDHQRIFRLRRRCTAITRAGTQCRNFATWGTDPPRCSPHGGRL